MAQQNIEYGNFPDDPSADAIRIAFQKTQDNFTELYGNLSNIASNVTSITAGNGITVSSSTGAVTVDSTFNLLNFHSNTLYVTGIGGTVTFGGNIGEDYTVNNASSTLVVELNSNISPIFANLITTGNLQVDGNNITSANANITLSNGNITLSNGTFTGNISGTANTVQFVSPSGIVTADVNFLYDQGNTSLTLVNGTVTAANIDSQYQLNAVTINATGNVYSNNAIVTDTISASAIQFTGLSSDPTPSPGLMYYNSVTGSLRIYNGILSQWQDLN